MAQLIGNAVTGTQVGETVSLPITHQTLLSSDGMVITLHSDDKLITTTGLQKLQRQTFTVPEVSTEPDHPPLKRIKKEVDADIGFTESQSVKQILFNINKAICLRLDSIESKLETISTKTQDLEEKVDRVSNQLKEGSLNALSNSTLRAGKSGAVIVGVPHDNEDSIDGDSDSGVQNLGPNVTLITLNSEEDFPHGCWLGDESNPEMRVRAPITPSDLLHIHSNCRTAEKMALTLLDYLFDRETQAYSNLSGMGKHGKRQLDPLMIYGVRCHLIHRFGVTEQDWHRIKQNVDSKCRTAFRRKTRGLPLMVKAFRGKAPPTYAYVSQNIHGHAFQMQEIGSADDLQNLEDGQLHIHERKSLMNLPSVEQTPDVDLSPGSSVINASEILQNAGGGEIQVLHATPEQVAQLQQTHQIQILQGGQIVGSDDVQVSMGGGMDGVNIVQIRPEDVCDDMTIKTQHLTQRNNDSDDVQVSMGAGMDGVNIVQIRPEDVCDDDDEDPPSDTAEQ